ncbi:MAG: diaminopimelate epimerase [Acidimicrobiia bacterium]|nr:diaminopimelate epimerase [Acidimicrobiia bacterium]
MDMTKHHGLGNDFLVLLEENQTVPMPPAEALGDLAQRWCDRHRGIGADGLIAGYLPTPDDGGVGVRQELRNADGSMAELSGNGIRCLGHAVSMARGGIGDLRVATAAGVRQLGIASGATADEVEVTVQMGRAGAGPDMGDLDLGPGRRWCTVDVGNPHLVVVLDGADPAALDGVDVSAEGAALERRVSGGVNVHFVVVERDDRLAMAIWERGVGRTEACGTGATAAVAALRGWDLLAPAVEVAMPGGSVRVTQSAEGDLALVGPSVFVARVETCGDGGS